MVALIDTVVLIDYLRGRAEARDLIRDTLRRDGAIFGSVLTRAEVLAGVRPGEERATMELLSAITWMPVSAEIADAAGGLAGRWMRSHSGIDIVDYVVAATTASLAAELKTRNVKHFPMFADLVAPY